jgi:mono/diheme cytochrome c family protein
MRLLVILVACVLAVSAGAFPWDKDMVDQPSVKSQESLVEFRTDTVSAKGKEALPVPRTGKELVRARVAAGRELKNPVAPTAESVAAGKKAYETHCAMCHGATGQGEGSVGQRYVPPPMNLTLPYVQQQGDGQVYYTITHGSLIMPFYRDALSPKERWHVVNYIKTELGKP